MCIHTTVYLLLSDYWDSTTVQLFLLIEPSIIYNLNFTSYDDEIMISDISNSVDKYHSLEFCWNEQKWHFSKFFNEENYNF